MSAQGKWKIPLAYALGLVAAGILAVAAFYKAGDPGLFFDQISAHQVTPPSWSPYVAYFFITVELLAAAAFVAFIWPRLVFASTILMMLGFIGVTAWAWMQGNTEGCGCFGRLLERGPEEVIIEDLIVILLSVIGLHLTGGWRWRNPRAFRTRPWQWCFAGPLIILALVLTVFGPALPLDEVIVGIRPGTDLSDMALQGVRFPLDEGLVLLALVGPDCPRCDAGIPALKQIAAEQRVPHVLAVYPVTPEQRGAAQAWRLKHRPNFPIATAAARALRQYYRRLPTTFLLRDGRIVRTWWGQIPAPEEVSK